MHAILAVLLLVAVCFASEHSIVKTIVTIEAELVDYPVAGTNVLGPASYVYVAADSKVRVSTARASITRDNLDTGSDTTTTTRTWARSQGLPTDDAGHILANRLGGSGKDPVNIFPQNPSINRGAYRVFEGKIAECLNGTTVSITATLSWAFSYINSTYTRPMNISYCALYSAPSSICVDACQLFPNYEPDTSTTSDPTTTVPTTSTLTSTSGTTSGTTTSTSTTINPTSTSSLPFTLTSTTSSANYPFTFSFFAIFTAFLLL